MRNFAQSTLLAAGVLALLVTSVTTSSGITNTVGVNTSWSFETYTNGEQIVDTEIDSWYGSEADSLLAKTNSYTPPSGGNPISGNHNVVMELVSDASNLVESVDLGNIWIEHIVKPTRWDQEGHPSNNLPADAQMAYYVSTNNHIVIYHTAYDNGVGGVLSEVWTEISEPEIASNEWIRVSINMDYDYFSAEYPNGGWDSCYFRMMVNGQTLTNSAAKGGDYFAMATGLSVTKMRSIQLQGTGLFDDFVVTTTEPTNFTFVTNYTIVASVAEGAEGGMITPFGITSVNEGSNQTFTTSTSNYWILAKLIYEENGTVHTNTSSSSNTFSSVTTNGYIMAYFEKPMTNGVPTEWLEAFGIGSDSPTNDWDNDGISNADEYIGSTHPTNAMSYLRVLRSWRDGGTNYIEWESQGIDPQLPPFTVESSTNLTDGFVTNGSSVTRSATNTWSQSVSGTNIFYRVKASDVAP